MRTLTCAVLLAAFLHGFFTEQAKHVAEIQRIKEQQMQRIEKLTAECGFLGENI